MRSHRQQGISQGCLAACLKSSRDCISTAGLFICELQHAWCVQVSVGAVVDMELADHLLSLLNTALSSPEAQHALPLRKCFVDTLLNLGATSFSYNLAYQEAAGTA